MSMQNSYAEFVLGTLTAMLKDFADMYPDSTKEFERDEKRLSSAVNSHGIEFALITMPAFRKHFDKCLSEGRLTPSGLNNFGPIKRKGSIPRLFRGLTLRVFDSLGALRSDADPQAIRCIRQILGSCRKLRVDCGLKNTREAVREYFRVDAAVASPSPFWEQVPSDPIDPDDTVSFSDYRVAEPIATLFEGWPHPSRLADINGVLPVVQQVADLLASTLGIFDPAAWATRHGPGAVADQRFGAYKYAFKTWAARLESVFPYAEFGVANYSQWGEQVLADVLPRETEVPAKLCAVPKTRTTPRLIAVETVANQWCQQSIREYFYKRVSGTLISSFIRFDKQEVNSELALEASLRQSHSTIDLSSASDRISCGHVERLFRRSPALLHAMRATRAGWLHQDICRLSPRYSRIRKYSTMGNATTFPVQSLFFLALALSCEIYRRGAPVTFKTIRELKKVKVRVFGDDIITPTTSSGLLVDLIHHLGLKVNTSKTFEHGMFKESCGVDAFAGHDVTTVNVMDVPRRAKPGTIVSSVDSVKNLLSRGYHHTAAYVQKSAEREGALGIPTVKHGSGSFGWWPNYLVTPRTVRTRFCRDRQSLQARVLTLSVRERKSSAVEGYGLLQFFTEAPKQVTSAVSTLGYLVRRPQVSLRLRWAFLDDLQ